MNKENLGYYKVIKTGKLIEIYQSQIPFISCDDKNIDIEPGQIPLKLFPVEKIKRVRDLEYRIRSAYRARNKIRRLVQTNFTKKAKFITLTFKNNESLNINSPEETYLVLRSFLAKLKRVFGNFKFLYVLEFQKRGAVHYHMICDIPYVENSDLAELWGYGFVRINQIDRSDRVGIYISKYLTKDLYLDQNVKYKKFGYSRNLTKPTIFYGIYAQRLLHHFFENKIKPSYSGVYDSLYNGQIRFYEFNLYREGVTKNESLYNRDT